MTAPKVLSENLVLYPGTYFENTCKVVAPTSAMPRGRVVLNIGQPRSVAGLVYRDLLDASSNLASAALGTRVPYPIDPATQFNATDNQIIRLQDGSLLALKNGYTTADVSPPPPWFNTGSFQYGTSVFSGQARNCVFLFGSTDAGSTWTLRSVIDSAVVEGGKYGWPQPNEGPTGFGIGGFDRTELYQDPYSGHIYVSGHGDAGPYTVGGVTTENHAGVIFRSTDNAHTFSTFHVFASEWNYAPYEMTSTPDHPLIVIEIKGSPLLYYVENGVMSAGVDVTASDGGTALPAGLDAGVDDIRGTPVCIARIGAQPSGRDAVWIAYPTVNSHGRTEYVIATVTFGGTATPEVFLVTKVAAADPVNASAMMGSFVQNDHADAATVEPVANALFTWVDAPIQTAPDPNALATRCKLFVADGTTFPSAYLSVHDGAKRTFSRLGMGDYFSGGFVWLNDMLTYFVQWPESGQIVANVVTWLPPPSRRDVNGLAIDPLYLILSNEIYVLLTLPDPPPLEAMVAELAPRLARLSLAQRRAVLERAAGFRERATVFERAVERTVADLARR
nr:hypothetical protein [Kofleriaceae bacterium]